MASEGRPTWEFVVARKRSQQKDLLAPWLDSTVAKDDTSITDIDDADVLVKALTEGAYSAVTVTRAYIKR